MAREAPHLLAFLHWLGHASFRLDRPQVIYIDPWRLPPGSPMADLILISHDHFDHCSPQDVARIRREGTTVIANAAAAQKLDPPVEVLRAGDLKVVGSVTITALPAYNVSKRFHTKDAGGLGFVLTLEGERLYFAGDTDLTPEMKGVECDVALLPVSGTYVMDAEQAAEAARALSPRVAVPMHYGAGVVGSIEDAERFRSLCPVPVRILQAEGGAIR